MDDHFANGPPTATDFELQAKEMSYATRPGDLVRIRAPDTSMASPFNDCAGSILRFMDGGWVVVNVDGHGALRFRADELVVL